MKKKLKIFINIIIFLIIFMNSALATEGHSMEVSITSNKKKYEVGEEILINISIDEIKGFSGVNTFLARKVYDTENVEYIEAEVANNNWKIAGDEENILLRKTEGEDLKKGKICTLKFKALKAENTKIQISNLDACNDEGDVYYEDGNVNSPFIEISISNSEGTQKSYIGIILITAGILGIVAVSIHYIINKKKV